MQHEVKVTSSPVLTTEQYNNAFCLLVTGKSVEEIIKALEDKSELKEEK